MTTEDNHSALASSSALRHFSLKNSAYRHHVRNIPLSNTAHRVWIHQPKIYGRVFMLPTIGLMKFGFVENMHLNLKFFLRKSSEIKSITCRQVVHRPNHD